LTIGDRVNVRDRRLRIAVLGAGAVGGYYGAVLARAGADVTLIARGAHLATIRERGIAVRSVLGDFVAHTRAEADPASIGAVDVVILAVKTYDNPSALPMLTPLVGKGAAVLTLQNGVESAEEVAAAVGEAAVLAGATYIASALASPGVIQHTGTHRRIVFGEAFGDRRVTPRVEAIRDVLARAEVNVEAVADVRVPLWEKFAYLAPFAAFTGAARLPTGVLWRDPAIRATFMDACAEVTSVARAEGVDLPPGQEERVARLMDSLAPSTQSSLLIDLAAGKRIEVEALQGAVVRRGARAGVPTPIMAALYAVLKPYAGGPPALS
jgi:2-dehydropantoate 2-reductase